MASSQKVFIVDSKYDADVKAYLVENKYDADILGTVVSSKYDADMKIFIVNSKYDANVKVYLEQKSSGGCFISSACVYSKGLPDDCYELNTLRRFRDNYLANSESGRALIKEYYDFAPKLVDNINKSSNKNEVYEQLYHELVIKCVNFIDHNEFEKAQDNYIEIVTKLKNTFCS